jgi:hypothetical protein
MLVTQFDDVGCFARLANLWSNDDEGNAAKFSTIKDFI